MILEIADTPNFDEARVQFRNTLTPILHRRERKIIDKFCGRLLF